ncbi:glycosyltransferase [Marinilabilia rubra]|uniref:Family 2 glycosyl transferase n=1 Tax=Marinilabilia rubra TaxID=2162893 RepID=A0A2U2BA85_9BACT|nr:glycosyltransferase [Marinilabilia rubra]PWD99946.1 family 2 glycosyl transferase [Marinilabilia rubra]
MTTPEKSLKLLDNYLTKHYPEFSVDSEIDSELGLIVVIPAYLENELILTTLNSLISCKPPSAKVEVIVVLNTCEKDSKSTEENQNACADAIQSFIHEHPLPNWLSVNILKAYNLRKKHFGAGLARKIGLDEAVRQFRKIERPDGILACLDADSPVAPNYLQALENWFSDQRNQGGTVYFEHPLEGSEYSPVIYEAITLYELHLRYYVEALKQTGFPYAFHTIGSCMVFRTLKYVQAGGMPKKQAGEDFYFLQKLIPLGNFGNLTETTVYPSPRPSDRVIFGTGASIKHHLDGTKEQGITYNPAAFDDLKHFFSKAPELAELDIPDFENWTYDLTGPLRSFLLNSGFEKEIEIIRKNSNSKKTFLKRFFGSFNAFKVVKYLNYAHEHFYAKSELFEAALLILERSMNTGSDAFDEKELLLEYREMERMQLSVVSSQ